MWYSNTVPSKVLEQNKKNSHNFKRCVNLKCPLQTIRIEDQAQRFRWAWSSIHIVWYPASGFAENWLFCVGLLESYGYINFVHFTNCSRTFGGYCIAISQYLGTWMNWTWDLSNVHHYFKNGCVRLICTCNILMKYETSAITCSKPKVRLSFLNHLDVK